MSLRKRIRTSLSHIDAFPKTEASYQERTSSGGLVTLIVSVLLAVLALSEFADYRRLDQKYEFLVDQTGRENSASKLQVNVDVTLSMPCQFLTIDVVDVGGTSLHVRNALKADPTAFSVGNARQLGEGSGDALNVQRLIKQAQQMGREQAASGGEATTGCRVYGSFEVNKVMGNLHITALGHGYGGEHVPHDAMNFTHRIDKLSFGKNYPGLINPLDNSVEIATENFQQFQYYVSIVPTIYLDNSGNVLLTSQYAVTDYKRKLDGQTTGLPGIFFKYDIEAISVRISETRKSFLQFLVRLCGIIGGLFAAVGMVHSMAGTVVRRTKEALKDGGKVSLDGNKRF